MNRARSIVAIFSVALLAISLPGTTAAQDEPASTSPEGVEWQLAGYATDGALQRVPPEVTATMLLEGGQVSGSAGCNSFLGTYRIDGPRLTFDSDFGRTEMYCEGDPQAVEDAYLAALTTVTSWSRDGRDLELAADGAAVLHFTVPGTATSEVEMAALVEALRLEVRELQARVAALEAGATADQLAMERKPRKPKAPKAAGKVRTTFPESMVDEFRPEAERSDERNRETVSWIDRSADEQGFNVYARRGFCTLRKGADASQPLTAKDFRTGRGKAVLVDSLPADSASYQPDHAAIEALLPERPETGYSNDQFYDLHVTAFNEAGESKPALVGSYYLTPEFRCP